MCTETDLFAALDRHLGTAATLREKLHSEPELSGHEAVTRDRVLAALPGGITITEVAGTGAIARVGGAGPSIGVRAELDALPVTETTDAPFTSCREGIAHACGHDVHLAALVAAAATIHEAALDVPLLAVLQPREETYPSGAKDITESGALTREQCAMMIGAHLQPTLDPGVVACVPGRVNASADEFEIHVHGTPGHAAYPHLAEDPIPALAGIVAALQGIVSRAVDPMMAAVIGVSSISAGSAANVIPGIARATGTIRAMTPGTRELLQRRVTDVARHVARAHGCDAEVTITAGEPVLENDPALVQAISRHLTRQGTTLSMTLRSLGADDFSYYSERMPAAMMFIGSASDRPLHSPSFLPSETDLRTTARAMLAGYLGAAGLLTSATQEQRD